MGGASDDGQGVPGMAMTATVKDELSRAAVSKVRPARPRSRHCSGSPAACTWWPAG